MSIIRRHIPAFCEGEDPNVVVPFETLEDLLSIPFVNGWKARSQDCSERIAHKFYRFSVSVSSGNWFPEGANNVPGKNMLMAEFDKGRIWFVVGSIEGTVPPELPEWKPKYRKAKNAKSGEQRGTQE